ncbi:7tm 7 domain containing protein, partial [Asbolus verrucosus]
MEPLINMSEIDRVKKEVFKKFLNSVRPLLFQNQIFGLVTFGHDETSFRPFKIRNICNILAICTFAMLLIFHIFKLAVLNPDEQAIYKFTYVLATGFSGDRISRHLLLVVNSATSHQSVELISMLRARFVILNNQINSLIKSTPLIGEPTRLLPLNQICALHHHLSKLITLFNDIFGVILLLMFGICFIIMVLIVFFTVVELQATHTNWFIIVLRIVMTLNFFVDPIYVCDVCYATVEE